MSRVAMKTAKTTIYQVAFMVPMIMMIRQSRERQRKRGLC
jgi:hypothetical protein